jgi:zinc protease
MLAAGCRVAQGPVRVGDSIVGADVIAPGGRETRVAMTLPNGLKVVLEENHLAPVVALQAWVGVGSADEPPELAGIAHIFEHLLWKSTKKRGVGQIAREVAAAGGEINAWTSFDQTVYHLVLASTSFDLGLDILADALTSATFDPAELTRERSRVLAEIKQGQENADRSATDMLFRAAFPSHPYGRPVLGSETTVAAVTREQLLAFYERAYVGRNVTLVIVGDFDGGAAKDKIRSAFAAMRKGATLPARPLEPPQTAPRTMVAARDIPETQLLLSFRTPAIAHADVPALDLLAMILGQGERARLTMQVVRSRQLVSSATSYMFTSRDGGLLVVSASMSPGRLEEPARAILEQVLRLGREEVSPVELARARGMVESGLVRDKQTPRGYARKLGFFATVAGDADFEARYLERIAATTPADLRTVAARYLRTNNLTSAALVSGRGASAASRARLDTAKLSTRLEAVWASAEGRANQRFTPVVAATTSTTDGVTRVVLPSGLRILVLRDPTLDIVNVQAVWPGGMRNEDARSNGISNLLATLLVRGTNTRSADDIRTELEGMSASLSGFSGRTSLGLRAEFPSAQWEAGVDLVADCIVNPRFSEDQLDRERRVVFEQLRGEERNPVGLAFRLFASTLWSKHPYRLPELGTTDSIASLSRRRILDHYRRYYGVSVLTIAVVGNVNPAGVVARLQALLGDAPAPAGEVAPAATIPTLPVEPARGEPAEVFRLSQDDDAHVVLGYPSVTLRDPDRFPLQLLAEALSGPQGRLDGALRTQHPLAYRSSAHTVEGIDPGYFAIYLACSPQNLEPSVGAARAELARLAEHGLTGEELTRARQHLVGAHALSLERRSAIAAALAFHEAYGQGWREYRRYAENLRKVTVADVQRVAHQYLDPRREVVAVIKPADVSPAVARRGKNEPRLDVVVPAVLKTVGAVRSSAP